IACPETRAAGSWVLVIARSAVGEQVTGMTWITPSFCGFRSQVLPLRTVALIVTGAQPEPQAGAWAEKVIEWPGPPGVRSGSPEQRRRGCGPATGTQPGSLLVKLRAPAAVTSTTAPFATAVPRLLAVSVKEKEEPQATGAGGTTLPTTSARSASGGTIRV